MDKIGWKRAALSLGVSLAVNLVLIFSPVDPQATSHSAIDTIFDFMGRPAGIITEWLLPGHDFQQVVFIIVASVFFYWIVFWILLELAGLINSRRLKVSP